MTTKLFSCAKINLGLVIKDKLPNGYHEVETILATIPLFDELEITDAESGLYLTCSDPKIPTDERNLLRQIYQKMAALVPAKKGLKIHLQKNIPAGAGLGGGSLNGTTLIQYLNTHWQLGLSPIQLVNLAKEVSSDAAFSLIAPVAKETKHGLINEGEIKPLGKLPSVTMLLVWPKIEISGREAYALWDEQGLRDDFMLEEKADHTRLHNSFELIMLKKYPIIKAVKNNLLENGATSALMTGKGSGVYGFFANEEGAKKADIALTNVCHDYQSWILNL
jgi:4-diphosphocytidyl-2-C-methyl-D-erythritol kinase